MSNAGGAATSSGMEFQWRVVAWAATSILADKLASPTFGLGSDTSLEWVRCETEQPVDDILLGTSEGGLVFVQAKKTLHHSKHSGSDLASTLAQFVRQYLAKQNGPTGKQPWDRPLDEARDRLVLLTSPSSSAAIRVQLTSLLNRVRSGIGASVDVCATNDAERDLLDSLVTHVAAPWKAIQGTTPSDTDLRSLLGFVHVVVLDLDDGGTSQREATALLRSTVLRDPAQASAAWAQLVSLAAHLSTTRSGASRADLQRECLRAGLDVRPASRFENDIRSLLEHSTHTVDALAESSVIRLGDTTVKIDREVGDAIQRAAQVGSILVVGEPGAGKSGVLHDVVAAISKSGYDCVFLAVDHLSAQSLPSLRHELGLEREVLDVLQNWPGMKPGFLVIDALDAARGDTAGLMLRDLIRGTLAIGSRWRVIASVRKFDLRYGISLRALFRGKPDTQFVDAEFQDVRHVNVPQLSSDELAQLAPQSPALASLVTEAPPALNSLLRVVFNLRLMAVLLTTVPREELTPIKTQLELLNRYWYARVIRDDFGSDAREGVLRKACEEMVRARVLRADRAAVAVGSPSVALNELLSQQVLLEWQATAHSVPVRYVLSFAHHVLFDFAASRLILSPVASELVARLKADPDLGIVIRPSLTMFFREQWNADPTREHFWNLALTVATAPGISEISKLVGPTVAAELATAIADFEPLFQALEGASGAPLSTFGHVVGALLAPGSGSILAGKSAGPWSDLAARAARTNGPHLLYGVRMLLSAICDQADQFTDPQRAMAGEAARWLLATAWDRQQDPWLVVHGIQGVCRTFESNQKASRSLLLRCLEPSRVGEHGFQELPWLAREIPRLLYLDAPLVEEVYKTAFCYEEESSAPTSMGAGRIMALVSNRRQDYEMALYELAGTFPAFLAAADEPATRALVAAVECHAARRSARTGSIGDVQAVPFRTRQARLLMDFSSIWDEGDRHRHEDVLRMLDAFQKHVEDAASAEGAQGRWRRMLDVVLETNQCAALWRRLLRAGAKCPSTLGHELAPLASALPFLTGYDTSGPVGELLRTAYPYFTPSERADVEGAIIGIPMQFPVDRRSAAEHIRDRLLGCLPESLVTPNARALIERLQRENAIPSNDVYPRFHVEGGQYGEVEYLRDAGVPTDAPANIAIRAAEAPAIEFASKHLNSVPRPDDVSAVLPHLRGLLSALESADSDGVHPRQRDHGWGTLTAAAARVAAAAASGLEVGVWGFAKDVLLRASSHPDPAPQPDIDAQFDDHPSWGSPAARLDAAHGLVLLSSGSAPAAVDVLAAIERLAGDRVPAVRYQVARSLNALAYSAPDTMWRLVDSYSAYESSCGVLQGLLAGPLQRLAASYPDRIAALAKGLFTRVADGRGASTVRELCVGILAGLFLWQAHDASGAVIDDIIDHPRRYASEAGHVLGLLREAFRSGGVNRTTVVADAVRQRAFCLAERLLQASLRELAALEDSSHGKAFAEWSERNVAEAIARTIDSLAHEVYFASGAFDDRRPGTVQDRGPTPEDARFYHEATRLLDGLAEVGLPSVTHKLLETLEYFLPTAPAEVFQRVGRVIRVGQRGGYQYESLAIDLVVRIVDRFLAEHRALLRDDANCRQVLIEVLDTFVRVGWPSARRLTYGLEEIFR